MSDKIEKGYYCPYCKNTFNALVGVTGGGVDDRGRKISCVSSKVICPVCSNILKTWKDKEEREFMRLTK